jgi:hypothetical protein
MAADEKPGPDVIPDLDVAVPARAAAAKQPFEALSVKDMEDFGIEGQPVALDLDVSADPPPSLRQPAQPPAAPAAPTEPGVVEVPSQPETPGATAPRPATAADRWQHAVAFVRSIWDDDAPLGLQLMPGIALAVLAILVTVGSWIYASSTGETLQGVGVLSGILLIAGIGLVVYRLVRHSQ